MSLSVHTKRCQECRLRVRQLLTELYGVCWVNYSFPWSSNPEAYGGTTVGKILEAIQKELQQLRGFHDFIKAQQMPPCDFYLPEASLIVEFDESQHFTRPRQVTLKHYRPEVPVGFSTAQWIDLCTSIDAVDTDPPDRDERRAWYDTLRDIVPSLYGFKPTVRIYSDAFRWCSLDADSKDDLATFRSLLKYLPESQR